MYQVLGLLFRSILNMHIRYVSTIRPSKSHNFGLSIGESCQVVNHLLKWSPFVIKVLIVLLIVQNLSFIHILGYLVSKVQDDLPTRIITILKRKWTVKRNYHAMAASYFRLTIKKLHKQYTKLSNI